jgi:hypothetical protein
VRKFYEARDEDLSGEACDMTQRKRKAAAALIAVIGSAADSIRGGLLDPSVDVVIPVDDLLVLLGEAMVFINRGCISCQTTFADEEQSGRRISTRSS